MRDRLMRAVRRIVPSVPVLTRSRLLFAPLDLVDRLVAVAYPETRGLPPARLRIRTGVRSRLVFNQVWFKYSMRGFWEDAFAAGWLDTKSAVLELGSGSGRATTGLREFGRDRRFRGTYTGIDVDQEMVDWCQAAYPKNFTFHRLDVFSRVYNPGGRKGRVTFPVADSSQDFVYATSLFSHLLEEDFINYLEESARVMRPGARMAITVFSVDPDPKAERGGRWTFAHRRGAAHVESERYPEAAVAYESGWLANQCELAGFTAPELVTKKSQSLLTAVRR